MLRKSLQAYYFNAVFYNTFLLKILCILTVNLNRLGTESLRSVVINLWAMISLGIK